MRLRSFFLCLALCGLVAAQKTPAKPAAKASAAAASPACQVRPNPAYDAEIKRDTTLPNFSTEVVDHLPADSCVDDPLKFFGHISGAPDVLEYSERLNDYYRHLASQSPRVKAFTIGTSEEGHEMTMVAISDEDTIAHLDHYKDLTARLADPRGLNDAEAANIIAQDKPMYWIDGSIHSSETGSPEMLMELAYRLAVEDSPFIQNIRKHEIVLITPVTETDGRDREVDLYMNRKKHPDAPEPGLIWWGHYVNHDNNRDGLTLGLALSRTMTSTYLNWHPQVLHDLHESVSYLYISTGTGPYNPWLDPLEVDEWQSMAYYEIDQLTKRNVIGVWTHDYFDGWAPNYMLYAAIGHNAIGRFYETQGNSGANTGTVNGGQYASKQWYRPNPPLPSVLWSARDNTNMQESGLLFGLTNMANNSSEFLHDFYLKSRRSVEKATSEGPAAWVLPGDEARSGAQARLIDQLQQQGVEVSRADADFAAEGKKYPTGSYIIRMDQPYSREADMLLGQEYYNPSDPSPYDDTGWTMGALADVQTVKVNDVAILKTPMTKVAAPMPPPGGVNGAGSVYLINANADPNLATFRFANRDVAMNVAERAFDANGKHYNAGTVIIPNGDATRLGEAAKAAGVRLDAVATAPQVTTHPLESPRIAVVHNWQSPVEDGWARITFDELKIPYTYIATTRLRDMSNLRSQFDVILIMPLGNSLAAILNDGVGGSAPIAWKNTPDMSHLESAGDSSDDIRGGLGFSGLQNLESFVNQGGLVIAVGNSVTLATDLGFAEGVGTRPAPTGADGLNARGAVLRAEIADATSPVAYGFGQNLAVYYSTGMLLTAGAGGGGRGAFGAAAAGGGRGRGGANRASGIGDATAPDVVQARPPADQLLDLSRQSGLGEGPDATAGRGAGAGRGGRGGANGPAPRVIVRFAPSDLLVSGLLAGGDNLTGQPLAVSAQHGQGYYLLFDANPLYRNETLGEFGLVFNAMLNYKNLNAGAAPAAAPAGRGRRGGQ